MAKSNEKYTRNDFFACDWNYNVDAKNHHGYSSIMQSLEECIKEKAKSGLETQQNTLTLLSRLVSMRLSPTSLNEPFSPFFHDIQAKRRSPLPGDFTEDELQFFDEILADIAEPWLKSRLADLLWLCKKPRNPDYAKTAIDSYTSHSLNSDTWHRDVNNCWERAARLSMQLKDFGRLDKIKNQLFTAFKAECSNCKFMALWLAELMDKLNIDCNVTDDIAFTLFNIGNDLVDLGDFNSARSYYELSVKKYKQSDDTNGWLESLVALANCFEKEADSRVASSNMVANSLYENAVQAFRRIPTKHRKNYNVSEGIDRNRKKISLTGKETLNEMGLVKIPGTDLSRIIELSISHVSGKQSVEDALKYFAGLHPCPNYNAFRSSAQESIKDNQISNLFGSTQISSDGRIIGKIPPMELNEGDDAQRNEIILNYQIQQHFQIATQVAVDGKILPALRQILLEHRVTKELLEILCNHSPIVPEGRAYLLGHALWLGFEHDFGSSIYLLCPQVEHIVRMKLKEVGAHTSNIDRNGIEHENGLSTLMELPQAAQIFGEDLCFELTSIFTDSIGANLRNEAAHGLLSDKSSSSISTVYAWWMVLRIIVHSSIGAHDSYEERI